LERLGFDVLRVDLTREALPGVLDPAHDVVFPVLHGTWGEDGALQALLEDAGLPYVGCDARASRLCMDKPATKAAAARAGVPVAKGVSIEEASSRTPAELVAMLGPQIVLKPAAEGSSVGLTFVDGEAQLAEWLARPRRGRWMAEQRLHGRELTCGVLDGRAMGVVEIAPRSGVYDYASKYTAGASEYRFPAPIGAEATAAVQAHAAATFKACGCRDFARIDFILLPAGEPVLLEVNTMPGMTETSLLPKSASCVGLDFDALVRRMLEPCLGRAVRPAPCNA
jgi:D-alanine-D-alanine ligase